MLNLGDYTDTKMIGQGGFSVVFSGTHLDTNLPVAIKSVKKKNLLDKIVFMNFQREIRIIKSLDHPFIIHFYRIMEDDNYFYVVMENCQNGTLLNYINKKGRLSETEAQSIFCQILSALRYLHINREIVHRDLKMENILLTNQETIRLVDFGLSGELFARNESDHKNMTKSNSIEQNQTNMRRQRSNSVLLHTQCGSFPYAAPEIFRKLPYNASVDMWSAGVILYALVTGHLPFNDKNSGKLIQMILHEEPNYPSYLSTELVDLLKNLLNKDAKNRFTVKQASEHPWINHSTNGFLASESFLSQKQFHIFPQTIQDIDNEVVNRIDELDVPVDDFDTEVVNLMVKFQDHSIRYINIITNDNLQISSSADTIEIDANKNSNHIDLDRDRFGPNVEIKLNSNIRESQAFQYYRMIKNEKVSNTLFYQIKGSSNDQLASNSCGKLPSLKPISSSPQKSTNPESGNINLIPIPALNPRLSTMRRPVAQMDLIMMRKKQTGSRAARASMPIINQNK